MQEFRERRQCKRFRSKEAAGAFVAIRPTFHHIGSLRDVSLGGLGFHYMVSLDKKPLSQAKDPFDADLFVANNGFYLSKIKCRLAYDRLAEIQPMFELDVEYRECGVAFDQPTSEQKAQIALFLEHYTEGEA